MKAGKVSMSFHKPPSAWSRAWQTTGPQKGMGDNWPKRTDTGAQRGLGETSPARERPVRLTRGWARSSPVHPRDSPRWAARPPARGPHSAWASLSSGARLCPPVGCYSPRCHSGGSEPQAAGGSSWPHLGRAREKGCSALIPLGIQRPAGRPRGARGARGPVLPAEKPGGLCCTAFSSSSRRSSSERLLPREELITVGEGSADFCLLGKLRGTGEAVVRGAPQL